MSRSFFKSGPSLLVIPTEIYISVPEFRNSGMSISIFQWKSTIQVNSFNLINYEMYRERERERKCRYAIYGAN